MFYRLLWLWTFCMRSSAKDLGITRVAVVLVLFHLSHFLFKRNLCKKNLPDRDSNWGCFLPQPSNLINWALAALLHTHWEIVYLRSEFKKNHTADLAQVLVLVFPLLRSSSSQIRTRDVLVQNPKPATVQCGPLIPAKINFFGSWAVVLF